MEISRVSIVPLVMFGWVGCLPINHWSSRCLYSRFWPRWVVNYKSFWVDCFTRLIIPSNDDKNQPPPWCTNLNSSLEQTVRSHSWPLLGRLRMHNLSMTWIFLDTAKIIWNQSEAILWSKMHIFKRTFHNLRVLPHLCPAHDFQLLMRAFKWGTI